MLKLLTIAVAGILTVMTLKRLAQQFSANRARVKAGNPAAPGQVKRLKQDPSTGVYYPES